MKLYDEGFSSFLLWMSNRAVNYVRLFLLLVRVNL